MDIAIDRPGRDAYSYRARAELALELGDCVEVPFAGARLRGFVIARDVIPPAEVLPKLKEVIARRPGVRLPAHMLALIRWGARYWRCSLGEFLAAAVPEPVRAGTAMDPIILVRKRPDSGAKLTARQRAAWDALPEGELTRAEACAAGGCGPGVLERLAAADMVAIERRQEVLEVRMPAASEAHAPNAEQATAIAEVAAALAASRHQTFLLSGVTGSGKTLVYLELALKAISQGRQVLMLVPEIALTPQLAARVRSRIGRVVLWHSGFSDGERAWLWHACARGEVDLVLGTRSALFAPLPRPGLIIIDEEHDQSYKQESVPRYHARDLAVVYGSQLGVRWCSARPRPRSRPSTTCTRAATASSPCARARAGAPCRPRWWWTCATSTARPMRACRWRASSSRAWARAARAASRRSCCSTAAAGARW